MNDLAEYTVGFARRNCSVMALYHLSDIGQFIFYIFEHCAAVLYIMCIKSSLTTSLAILLDSMFNCLIVI